MATPNHIITAATVSTALSDDDNLSAADFLPLVDSDDSDSGDKSLDNSDSDSDSDVSMAESDEDEATEHDTTSQGDTALPTAVDNDIQGSTYAPFATVLGKRKSPDSSVEETSRSAEVQDHSKRSRRDQGDASNDAIEAVVARSDKSVVSPEVWHRIFIFCPPRLLGRLLRVNRLFNKYLDPSSSMQCQIPASSQSVLKSVEPDEIWRLSRNLFWPHMPHALAGKTELQTWQLVCSQSCLHCDKHMTSDNSRAEAAGYTVPGENGIRMVWPFATRSCGECLQRLSTKEFDLMMSSSIPSFLTPGLRFVLITPELASFTPAEVANGHSPPGVALTKVFWTADVQQLQHEFEQVKLLGSGAAEEWIKGLETRGKDMQKDSQRWEQWCSRNNNHLRQMKTLEYPGYVHSVSVPTILPQIISVATDGSGQDPSHVPEHFMPGFLPNGSGMSQHGAVYTTTNTNGANMVHVPAVLALHPSTSSAHQPMIQHRHKTKEEVAELKAARRAEIERRVVALDPPIAPNVLMHIPSFQAALHISTPMDDKSWAVLEPRLLAQRAEAEQRENEVREQLQLKEEAEAKIMQAAAAAAAATDEEWNEVQSPLRARLAHYADEIIHEGWDNGDKVDEENSPEFAVEALIYIRKRFYAEIAKEAAAAEAAGQSPVVDPRQGPFTQKLTLDNMKWIFELKVKPLTEPLRKEIFLCNGCVPSGRYYGFEGVIQHYAAKHTKALSAGNVVVHWRAEWPEHPPFTAVPKAFDYVFPEGSGPGGPGTELLGGPPQSYQPQQGILQNVGPIFPPYGGVNGDTYGAAPYGQYPPPNSQPPFMPLNGYAPPPSYGPAPGQAASYPPYSQGPPGMMQQPYGGSQFTSYPPQHGLPHQFPDQYRHQLEDVAHMSRDLWSSTNSLRDLSGAIRVAVVAHHLTRRFHAKFGSVLPLALFNDGLANHKDMRPVRNINELVCKVCHLGIGGYVSSESERKTFSLPQLTNHFQSKHIDPFHQMGQSENAPDWSADMVLLPDAAVLSNLRNAIGMDSHKYWLVSEAIPQAFAAPAGAPLLAMPTISQSFLQTDDAVPVEEYPPASADNHAKYYGGQGQEQEAPASQPSYEGAAYSGASLGGMSGAKSQAHYAPTVYLHPQYHQDIPSQPDSGGENRNDHKRNGGRRSQQGQRHDQKSKPEKKSKKQIKQDKAAAAAAKRAEEEEKMAEEEARREEDAIKAMWAADRVAIAKKSTNTDSDKDGKQWKKNKEGKENKPQQQETLEGAGRHQHNNKNQHKKQRHNKQQKQQQQQQQQQQHVRTSPRDTVSNGLLDALEQRLLTEQSRTAQHQHVGKDILSAQHRNEDAHLSNRGVLYEQPHQPGAQRRSRSPGPYQQMYDEPGYGQASDSRRDVQYLDREPQQSAPTYLPPGAPSQLETFIEYEIEHGTDEHGSYKVEHPVRRITQRDGRTVMIEDIRRPAREESPLTQARPRHEPIPASRQEEQPPAWSQHEYPPHPQYSSAGPSARAPAAWSPPPPPQTQSRMDEYGYEPRQHVPVSAATPHHHHQLQHQHQHRHQRQQRAQRAGSVVPPMTLAQQQQAQLTRADPEYYEEYDPRFPAAPPPTIVSQRQLRQY